LLRIEIETHDFELGFDIAGVGNTLISGSIVEISSDLKVEYEGTVFGKALGIPEVLQFTVDTSTSLNQGLLAAWLYDNVKGRKVERIVINRREVKRINQDEILQVIEEEIKMVG